MDDQQQRLERLRRRRESLTAASSPEDAREARELDEEIAEAERGSLLGSGERRTDTRLQGSPARCYVAAMMRQGPRGVSAPALRRDALRGTRWALARLRVAACRVRSSFAAHASVSRGPRRPGRVRVARARRGPARAAPALPRPAGAA